MTPRVPTPKNGPPRPDDLTVRELIIEASREEIRQQVPDEQSSSTGDDRWAQGEPPGMDPRAPSVPEPLPQPFFVLVIAGMLLATVLLVFQPPIKNTLPREVRGTWTTNEGRYASREFTLGVRSVAFRTGNADTAVTSHIIVRVRKSVVPDGTRFDVDYVDGPAASVLSSLEFIYRNEPRPEIVLAHLSEIVWTREPSLPSDR